MSSVLSNTASLKRSDLLVVVRVNSGAIPKYSVNGTSSGTVTIPVGAVLRNLGKKVVTPAQGSAASSASQVILLKVVRVESADNDAVGDGDDSGSEFYVNLLDGCVARV